MKFENIIQMLNESEKKSVITIDTPKEKVEYKFLNTILNILKNNSDKIVSPDVDTTLDSIISRIENIISKYRYNSDFIKDIITKFVNGVGLEIEDVNHYFYEIFGYFELSDKQILSIRSNMSKIIKDIMVKKSYSFGEIFDKIYSVFDEPNKTQLIERSRTFFKKSLTIKSISENQRGVGIGEVTFFMMCAIADSHITFRRTNNQIQGDVIVNEDVIDLKSFLSIDNKNIGKQVILNNRITYSVIKKSESSQLQHIVSNSMPIKLFTKDNDYEKISLIITLNGKKFWIEDLPYISSESIFRKTNSKSASKTLDDKKKFDNLPFNVKDENKIYHRFLMNSTNQLITSEHRKKILEIILEKAFENDNFVFIENKNDDIYFTPMLSSNISSYYKCDFNDNTNNFKIQPIK
jgi:hypothetical protein